jgi:hypothetical protein
VRAELPPGALLARYAGGGNYTDCYAAEVPGHVAHAEYVAAFYTTFVFKAERLILRVLLDLRSSDAQALDLAAERLDRFAAWNVEARAPDQLLMADYTGRTRSWLMSEAAAGSAGPATRLWFGSAVLPPPGRRNGLGQPFDLLLGFHKLYSRILLASARRRLQDRKLR